jgi:hypothetical protein
LAFAGLPTAPAANATCASFFSIGNSLACTSGPTGIAIATATATGPFTVGRGTG